MAAELSWTHCIILLCHVSSREYSVLGVSVCAI
jgi:hypothetical protein